MLSKCLLTYDVVDMNVRKVFDKKKVELRKQTRVETTLHVETILDICQLMIMTELSVKESSYQVNKDGHYRPHCGGVLLEHVVEFAYDGDLIF